MSIIIISNVRDILFGIHLMYFLKDFSYRVPAIDVRLFTI